jgi:hypothetical protein
MAPLLPYEDELLCLLSCFRGRQKTTQAQDSLTMYLRQSEAQILGELRYYARTLRLSEEELISQIKLDPKAVMQKIRDAYGSGGDPGSGEGENESQDF